LNRHDVKQDQPRVLLLIETSRGIDRELLAGISQYSSLHRSWSLYRKAPFYRTTSGRKSILSWLKGVHINGVIMREFEGVTEGILALGVPTIIFRHTERRFQQPCLLADERTIGKMGAEHFLDRGYRNFAFCGFNDMSWSLARGQCFLRRVGQAGFGVHLYQAPRLLSQKSWEKEPAFLAEWLKSLSKPVGVMACNDDRSEQILEACKLADLNVPEDVAILGVDNDELICTLTHPPLSSIALNARHCGFEAAQLLNKMMKGEKSGQRMISIKASHVVTRQSTDILATQDRQIAEAIRFIRMHGQEGIQVGDVGRAVGVSRRALQERFRQVLGRSIHDEIVRIRMETACRMLVETNMSVSEVAGSLGFSEIRYLTQCFRHIIGMSPLAYRKNYGQK
jgi:LacI family transcriptional regulator